MPPLTYIVPTLGRSPYFSRCIAALRKDARPGDEIWVVAQGGWQPPPEGIDKVLSLEVNRGFAGGCNEALRQTETPLVALINDDVLIEPGWTDRLAESFDHADVGAAQGVNLTWDDPQRVDGIGIGWNRWWQAVQLHHGGPAAKVPSADSVDIFGASATAVIYRSEALRQAANDDGSVFDERLFAYYEDVDLAVRLRAADYRAVRRQTHARHAASTTGGSLPTQKIRWLTRNRLWVLARMFGSGLSAQLPTIRQREFRDLAGDLRRFQLGAAWARVAGWSEARSRLAEFRHSGQPRISAEELARFVEAVP